MPGRSGSGAEEHLTGRAATARQARGMDANPERGLAGPASEPHHVPGLAADLFFQPHCPDAGRPIVVAARVPPSSILCFAAHGSGAGVEFWAIIERGNCDHQTQRAFPEPTVLCRQVRQPFPRHVAFSLAPHPHVFAPCAATEATPAATAGGLTATCPPGPHAGGSRAWPPSCEHVTAIGALGGPPMAGVQRSPRRRNRRMVCYGSQSFNHHDWRRAVSRGPVTPSA